MSWSKISADHIDGLDENMVWYSMQLLGLTPATGPGAYAAKQDFIKKGSELRQAMVLPLTHYGSLLSEISSARRRLRLVKNFKDARRGATDVAHQRDDSTVC